MGRRRHLQALAADRVQKGEAAGVEGEASVGSPGSSAVAPVSHDWKARAGSVAPDLMGSPGLEGHPKEGEAATVLNATPVGHRGLVVEGLSPAPRLPRVANHEDLVGALDGVGAKRLGEPLVGPLVEAQEQRARRRRVEAVVKPHIALPLREDGEDVLTPSPRSLTRQPGGLVYNDYESIPVELWQVVGHCPNLPHRRSGV